MDRQKLILALERRIDEFDETGDAAVVLSDQASAEARELAESPGGLQVAYTLGMFHHARVVANAQQGREDPASADGLAAMTHFHTLYFEAPDLLPNGLLDTMAQVWPVTDDMITRWASRALDLVRAGRQTGAPEVVADGIALLEHVTIRCRTAGYLSNLALAHRTKFLLTGEETDIAEAIQTAELAMSEAANESDLRSFRSNLAICCTARYERFGDLKDLDRSIQELGACTETSGSEKVAPGRLSNLAAALASRYMTTGSRHDLDEAISLFSQAVAVATEPRERAEYLANQAGAHQLRFVLTGDTIDLDLAVEAARTAVRDVENDSIVLPAMANTLGLALKSRYQRTGIDDDLQEAIEHFRSAADSPAGAPWRASHLNNLSSALRLAFVSSGDMATINEAVRSAEAAVSTNGAEATMAARHQSTLGAALSRRFAATGELADLDRACTATLRAAQSTSPEDSIRAAAYANAGLARRRRANHHTGATRRADLESAALAYATAAAAATSPPLVRAISAQDGGLAAVELGAWADAVAAFEAAITLLGEVTDDRLTPDDQGHQLTSLSGLGSMATAAALAAAEEAGRPDHVRAFSLLERGRGVILSRLLSTRDDLDDLRVRHRQLAAEFDRIRRELDQDAPADVSRWASPAARRRRLSDERDHLLETIRALPEFTGFLLPRLAAGEVVTPVDGPVVAINVAAHRCDALVVTREGVRHLPLPGLGQHDAVTNANKFLGALHSPGQADDKIVESVLRWMWNAIAEPILDELGVDGGRPDGDHLPRLWWMPTGALSMLPIHAAGYHHIPGKSVLDRVVSSYTPTLRTLRDAAARPAPAHERPLVVAVPETPGRRALVAARGEADRVASHFAAGAVCLIQDDAVPERVVSELATATWAHFACHANTDAVEPFRSHLTLRDGPLSVRRLASLRIPDAWLAYLSACTTAFSGTALSDEAIHISSVFQLAGFPHVIGTLWNVLDLPSERMAEYVYDELTRHSPARAVHAAQHRLRDRYPESPTTWAPHVHLGP
ncbi:CHAT domain-containing protein [Labedaea rhizosphaerae]|uniref:CHAT domain-containing protein n=1 Tax=Labedaea rhizosphaerae TaxID=598644 RepID=UPI001060BC9D|nr:CHAT domain-containing protein [Labedaea rhizosphaerae]